VSRNSAEIVGQDSILRPIFQSAFSSGVDTRRPMQSACRMQSCPLWIDMISNIDLRETNLARLREEPLDVLILGGGINGAGIARDLALRCLRGGVTLRIGLVEQRQFASGTSGKNSQLIHGGLRLPEGLEFGLVHEALHERATVLEMAPHLAHPQPFLIPMYSWFFAPVLWSGAFDL